MLSGDIWGSAWLILSGLVVGVVIAAPVGPVNIVCIQRTLERGFWGGFAAGMGAVLADGLMATLAAFGITAISGVMQQYALPIQLIGGGVLIAFGLKLFTAKPKLVKRKTGTSWSELRRMVDWLPERLRPALRFQIWRILPHAGIIPQTFFLTITNPAAIFGLLAIFGAVGQLIGEIKTYVQALTLVAATMAGSLLWWAFLSRLIERLRGRINEGRLKRINQAAGIVLVVFGGWLFVKFALGMTGHTADALTPTPASIESPFRLLGNTI